MFNNEALPKGTSLRTIQPALSFSTYFRYSSFVVAPITCLQRFFQSQASRVIANDYSEHPQC